jgi:NADH:ubiquinone reductase (H+-translocating)
VPKKIVIIGAGFGGLSAAKIFGGIKNIEVTVIDRRNYHLFQPLLYQVATAGLSPAEIAVPIRSELSKNKNTLVVMDTVREVDLQKKCVTTGNKKIPYDYLIIACGAQHSYFGKDQWEEFAPGLKTLEQATEIRRRILSSFEIAERETNLETRKALLTFIIVGGGPTGVEMAGSIAEISRHTLEKDFRHIDPSRTRVILIEAGERILQAFDTSLSKTATKDLEEIGVQVWTSTRVTNVTEDGVFLGSEFISARTVIWAAGVAPAALSRHLGVSLDKIGRVIVGPDLSVAEHPEVFVIGDQASFKTDKGTLPGLAPVAMQQGRHAARNVVRLLKEKQTKPFQYVDKGMMATIGRRRAIMEFKGFKASGLFAWLAWLFIHVFYLIGFQNKVVVFMRWTWSYLTFQKGSRLIINKVWKTDDSFDESSSVKKSE